MIDAADAVDFGGDWAYAILVVLPGARPWCQAPLEVHFADIDAVLAQDGVGHRNVEVDVRDTPNDAK